MAKKTIYYIFLLCVFFTIQSCSKTETSQDKIRIAIVAGTEGDAIKTIYKNYSKRIEIIELSYTALREQLQSSLSTNATNFDIVMIDDPWFPQLADYIAPLEPVPATLIDDIIPASLNLCKNPYGTGELKALPFVGNTQLLFSRSDRLREAGLNTPPQTWSELIRFASKLTTPENGKFGYAIRGRSGAPIVTDFLPIYWSLGGKLTHNSKGSLVESVDLETFISALEIYKQLCRLSPPGSINFDWTEMTAAFIHGTSAMELNWPAAISDIEKALPNDSNGSRWIISLPPGLKTTGTSMIGDWLLAIPISSTKKQEAKDLILWLMDQQKAVANTGRPPTRKSVYNELALKSPYFKVIEEALESSTYRDRTKKWSLIEDAVSRSVSSYISDDATAEATAKKLKKDIGIILQ